MSGHYEARYHVFVGGEWYCTFDSMQDAGWSAIGLDYFHDDVEIVRVLEWVAKIDLSCTPV